MIVTTKLENLGRFGGIYPVGVSHWLRPQATKGNASTSSARSPCGSDGPAGVERAVRQAYQHYVLALFPNPAAKGLWWSSRTSPPDASAASGVC